MTDFVAAEILPTVQKVLGTQDTIGSDAGLAGWGLDSVLTVNLFMALEEDLGITFDDEDLVGTNFESITTILVIANRARSAALQSAVSD